MTAMVETFIGSTPYSLAMTSALARDLRVKASFNSLAGVSSCGVNRGFVPGGIRLLLLKPGAV